MPNKSTSQCPLSLPLKIPLARPARNHSHDHDALCSSLDSGEGEMEGGMVRDYASTRKRDAMKEKYWEGVEVRQMDILVEGRARWKSRREGIRTGEGRRHGI